VVTVDELREWYEPDGDPREALGRYARRLRGGGALYLGGGIGVEAVRRMGTNNIPLESYSLVPGGEKYDGPLSAVTSAFTAAGKSTAIDTPGGATKVTEPSIAARLHELDASEREERNTLKRYELRQAARTKQGAVAYTSGVTSLSDDSWELRRMEECRANLVAIAAERKRLLAGKLSESTDVRVPADWRLAEAETGKPGTNFKQVGPAAKKKLSGILRHYAKSAHPFTDCVRDNTKRFGEDRAKRICAVDKDLIRKTTHWRKGGKKVTEELLSMVEAASARLAVVDETMGEGVVHALVTFSNALTEGDVGELAASCERDVILLHFNGDERATAVLEASKYASQHRHRDGKWNTVLGRVAAQADRHPLEGPDGELRSNTPHPPEPVAESGLIGALAETST
jgi:hypothetical protein